MSTLPTILLVPGAFHTPSCYASLFPHLHPFPVVTATLASVGPSAAGTDALADAARLRSQYLTPLVARERKAVVVVAHSYGGIPAGIAALGLAARGRGQPGVVGLVLLAAAVAAEGQSMLGLAGGAVPPHIAQDRPAPGLLTFQDAPRIFYSDLPEPEALVLARHVQPHSLAAFATPSARPAWAGAEFEGRRMYVRMAEDRCVPYDAQTAWLERSGVAWEVRDVQAGHFGFISKPAEVAALVKRFAAECGALGEDCGETSN